MMGVRASFPRKTTASAVRGRGGALRIFHAARPAARCHLFQPEVFASTTLAFATNRSAPAGDAARPWESMRSCSVSTLRAPASGWPFSGV